MTDFIPKRLPHYGNNKDENIPIFKTKKKYFNNSSETESPNF